MIRKYLTVLIAAFAVVSILIPTSSESGIFKGKIAAAEATNVSEVIGNGTGENSVTKDTSNADCKVTISFKEGISLENVKITVDSNYNIIVEGLNVGDYSITEYPGENGYKLGDPKLVSINLSNFKDVDISKVFGTLTYNTVGSDGTVKTMAAGSVYNPLTGVLSVKIDKPAQFSASIKQSDTTLTNPVVIQSDSEVVNGQLKTSPCILYTADAADDKLCVLLGGPRPSENTPISRE